MLVYKTPSEVVAHDGLRLVLVRGVPSPWSQATKTILGIKGLDYVAAPLDVGGANEEIVAWSGQNSGPVVAGRDGPPLRGLATQLRAQRVRGVPYFVGEGLSCVDIYWTAVMSMLLPLPAAQSPIRESSRPAFTASDPEIVSALDQILVEHRDRIFKAHFRDPMEF